MFTYAAYGLRISSVIELSELVPAPDGVDVTIRKKPEPAWLKDFKTDSQRIEIRDNTARFWFHEVGAFEVRDGCEIDIIAEPGVDASILRLYIQGMILAMLLQQRGFCVLHASVVRIHGEAVALCGPVGAGKSSLATALIGRGCELISDDNAAISTGNAGPTVVSAYPFVKLYPEIAMSLGFEKNELRKLHEIQLKVGGPMRKHFSEGTAPLRRIFILSKGTDTAICRLPQSLAAIELVRNSVPARWGHPAGAAHFRDCVDLARQVPAFTLKAFDSIADIQRVASSVLDHCDEYAAASAYAGNLSGTMARKLQLQI